MDMIIRRVEEKDYPEILKLNEADVKMLSPLVEDTLHCMSKITALFQVAEIEGRIAAFLMN